MLYPSINEIRKKADSRYTLAVLAAKRSRDLIDGKPALVKIDCGRPVSIAANEIAEDLIGYRRPDPNEKLEEQEVPEEETVQAEAGEEPEEAEEAEEQEEAPAEEE